MWRDFSIVHWAIKGTGFPQGHFKLSCGLPQGTPVSVQRSLGPDGLEPGISGPFPSSGSHFMGGALFRGLTRQRPGTAGLPPRSGVPSGRFALTGSSNAFLCCPFLCSLLPLGLPLPPANPMLLGTEIAPCLVRDCRVRAVPAAPEFPGLPPVFLGAEPLLFLAVRGRTPLSLGLDLLLVLGFGLCWNRCDAALRLLGLRLGVSLSGEFPGCLSRLVPLAGRTATRVLRFRKREAKLESSAYWPRRWVVQ